jgi:putative SOS response-associated peptidase YedK
LTTEAPAANELLQPESELARPENDHVPVILAPGAFAAWRDSRTSAAEPETLRRRYPADEMAALPVGSDISSTKNEGP